MARIMTQTEAAADFNILLNSAMVRSSCGFQHIAKFYKVGWVNRTVFAVANVLCLMEDKTGNGHG